MVGFDFDQGDAKIKWRDLWLVCKTPKKILSPLTWRYYRLEMTARVYRKSVIFFLRGVFGLVGDCLVDIIPRYNIGVPSRILISEKIAWGVGGNTGGGYFYNNFLYLARWRKVDDGRLVAPTYHLHVYVGNIATSFIPLCAK